ncbi:MAG: MiaB/RimO family radical SAM methylthiotransferase [Anaerolineaceae bacterium]|jgi:threonylcarbamoyladenosine tRNA methylthiotransferase MtaB
MKVFFDTVGCRLNQAEIEHLAGEFRAAGHEIVDSPERADLVVINTCAVTAAAASDSRQKSRQAYRAGAAEILLTGCLATLEPGLGAQLPGVSHIVSNQDKTRIAAMLLQREEGLDLEPLARAPLPGARKRTRAFIKVQDGCDNLCTFCVTRVARGKAVSASKEQILRNIEAAVAGGAQEVVLSGVHLGSWGIDLQDQETLTDLVEFILANSKINRLRLSSTEPWDLDARFFGLWQDQRMCRHLHLPLQSGSASVLKRMLRHTTPGEFRKLVRMAREMIPGTAITTDIIVGFPGETEDEFAESLRFVEEMEFSAGHVFKYSARPGTAASRLPGRVHGKVAHDRSRLMREVLQRSAMNFKAQHEGQVLKVLWESAIGQPDGNWRLHGFSDNYLEIEGLANSDRCNKIDRVKIQTLAEGSMAGDILL